MKNFKFIPVLCALAMVIAISGTVIGVSAAPTEASVDIKSPSAVLVEAGTGRVLYEHNSHARRPVASMVKIMTLCLAFDAIDGGNLGIGEELTISENAASMGGSQAFLDAHATYKTEELIKAIIVASANDACVAIAERLCGSVDGFVKAMNEKAAALGMADTNFVNCTGLPAPNQYSSAYDASLMFRELISHGRYFDYAKVWMFDFEHPSGRKTMLSNTNKLVRAYEGCDGGKTGFTNEAMYCLSATARRNGMRLVGVVTGAETSKIRNAEMCRLFDYGFANYESRQVIFKGIPIDEEFSYPRSKEKHCAVSPLTDEFYLTARGKAGELTYKKEFYDNLSLPIPAGTEVGRITVTAEDGTLIAESALVTATELNERGYLDVLQEFIDKWERDGCV